MTKGFLYLFLIGIGTSYAANGICQKCVRVREDNVRRATTEKQYEYYEDWLEDHHSTSEKKSDIEFGEEENDK